MERKKGLPSYPGSRLLHILISFFIILETVSIIAQATFLARAITFLFQRVPLTDVIRDIAFFFIAYLLRYLLAHVQQYLAENFAERTSTNLRNELVKSYFANGSRFIQTTGTGRLVTLAMEGIDNLKKYLEIISIRTIRSILSPILIAGYVFTQDKISAVILVVTVPIVIVFMILLGLAAQKMADRQYATYRVLSNHFIDSLKGLETLKYLGRSIQHAKNISRVSKQYRQATVRTLRIAFLSSFALDFFTSLSIAFVAVGLGFRLIDGVITLLPALTILILAPEYFAPIKQVGRDFHATLDGQVAMQEIDNVIKMDNDPIQANEKIEWNQTSKLIMDAVNVSEDNTPILKDISLSWKGTGLIGIVGESGAGKSTFINVLAGFQDPDRGLLQVDDTVLKTLKDPNWMENIAYIPQHPYIFPASLADNIRFYEPDATDAEVMKVIREIEMQDLVEELPNGMHELIGEGGRMLSGGQEQRIAMARVLLSNKPIVLLDEPTAHLDIETEYEIKQVMLRVFQNRFVCLATHRLHWMRDMDHLLVFDQGRLVEQGSHHELIAQNGKYHDLHVRRKGAI